MSAHKFKMIFGVTPETAVVVWQELVQHSNLPRGYEPIHLLWALMFPRLHCTLAVFAKLAGVSANTFTKWSGYFVRELSHLSDHKVSLSGWLLFSCVAEC